MDTPNSSGFPRRWREEKPVTAPVAPALKKRTTKPLLLLVCAAILVVLGAIGGLLSWIGPAPHPYILPIVVSQHPNPAMPLTQRDLDEVSGSFQRVASLNKRQDKKVIEEALAALKNLRVKDDVVVYLEAHAILDGAGAVQILPADADLSNPQTWISLSAILSYLRACPAHHQLLVLDVMRPISQPQSGQLYQDVAGSLDGELDAVPDSRRLVLSACSAGQNSYVSEDLGQSVFAHYVAEGLRGYAQGYASRKGQPNLVTVQDLAAFVRARVARWSQTNRTAPQAPRLIGTGDFPLLALEHGKPRDHVPAAAPPQYPEALIDGWKLRDSWWAKGSYRLAPRSFQQAQAALVEAENAWRGDHRLDADLAAVLRKTRAEFIRQQLIFQPVVVSLAQEEVTGKKPDFAVQKALREMMENLARLSAGANPEEIAKLKTKLRGDFLGKIQGTSDYDLEAAVFAWAVADPRHEPGTLRFLEEVLRWPGQRQPRYAESLVLHQLADLVYRIEGKDWPAALVGRVLHLTQISEIAAADPRAFPWNQVFLEEASQTRHRAEIHLWARGYAPLATAEKLAQEAVEQYQNILNQNDQVNRACAMLEEALALLPFYQTYLEFQPALQKDWELAAEAACDLAAFLDAAPARKKAANHAQAAAANFVRMTRLTQALADPMQELTKPFSHENCARLIEVIDTLKKGNDIPGTEALVLQQVEAILSVPALRLAAKDRMVLWQLGRSLARKLHEETVQLDQADDAQHVITAPPSRRTGLQPVPNSKDRDQITLRPEPPGTGSKPVLRQDEAIRAHRRAQITLKLLELGGMPGASLKPVRDLLAKASQKDEPKAWCHLGEIIETLYSRQLPTQYREETSAPTRVRLSWIASPRQYIPVIDDTELSAPALLRVHQSRRQWSWLAEQYRYLARDYRDIGLPGVGAPAAAKFYTWAAAVNQDIVRPGPEVIASVHNTRPLLPLESVERPVGALLEVQRLMPAGTYGSVDIRVTVPDAAWLQVAPENAHFPEVPGSREPRSLINKIPLEIRQRPGADTSFLPRPLGFLAQARFEGRTFHRLIPVSLLTRTKELEILVSTDPDHAEPSLNDIRLRPNKTPQPYYLFLRNLMPKQRRVTLALSLGDRAVHQWTTTLKPLETKRLEGKEASTAAKREAVGPVVLRATDTNTTDLLDQRRLPLDIAAPREYVHIFDIQYEPIGPSGKNKLMVKIQADKAKPGSPIPVELELPPQRPASQNGTQASTLRRELPGPDQPPVTLYMENIPLSARAEDEGTIYLHVDGLERAFIYRNKFTHSGAPRTPKLDERPAVRWQAPASVSSGPDVCFPIQVDNAPPGSSLEVSLGHGTLATFEPDREKRLPQAQNRQVWLQAPSADGALIFTAGVSDWTVSWDTSRMSGPHTLLARLMDSQGKIIARSVQKVMIDGDPPRLARFVDVPSKIKRGSALDIKAQGDDPESGIAQVVFFLGEPQKNQIPPNTTTVTAKPVDSNKTSWSARIQFPDDKKGPTTITAQFTNGVGLVRFHTTTVELTDVDPVASKPGAIYGKVLEGPRLQPGLEVILRNDQEREISRTKTQPDGTFHFNNLPAGRYILFCVKPESLRRATVPVVVEPGTTTRQNVTLEL